MSKGALAQCTKLELWNNQIGDDGMKALAEACAKGALASLETLDMSGNKIGNDGMKAFAKACRAKGALAFSLRNNQIGDAGMKALADACTMGPPLDKASASAVMPVSPILFEFRFM